MASLHRTLFLTASALIILLTGCSKSNQQAFSKRKYMPWYAKLHIKSDWKQQRTQRNAERTAHVSPTPQTDTATLSPRVLEPVFAQKTEVKSKSDETAAPFHQTEEKSTPTKNQELRKHVRSEKDVSKKHGIAWYRPTPLPKSHVLKNAISEGLVSKTSAQSHPNYTPIVLILLVILAVLLPPLAVLIVDGLSLSFLLGLALWLLFYIPGLIYALLVIFSY